MSWATRYKRGAPRFEDLRPEDARRAVSPNPENEVALVALAVRAPRLSASTAGFA
jgi:hypothetical protein